MARYSASVPGATDGRASVTRAAVRVRERVSLRRPAPPPAPRAAILVVNGFDRRGLSGDYSTEEARRFPWIRLCLEQLERHTASPYDVLAWDNSFLPEHLEILAASPRVTVYSDRKKQTDVRHARALERLLREVPSEAEYVVTLDTDSFPIRDGWLDNLLGRLVRGAWIAGIWRDEMAPRIEPFVHPSCLATRRDTFLHLGVGFRRDGGQDVGQNLTKAVVASGGRVSRLRRSNARDVHFLMGGIYGDLVYHHGAGSRHASFWTSTDRQADEEIRVALRDAAFNALDPLIDLLAGDSPLEEAAELGLEVVEGESAGAAGGTRRAS
jgi:hypothetical protein